MTAPTINYQSLKHSSIPTWLGLVAGSWAGLFWASLISLPVGAGAVVAAGSFAGGFWAVPLWGTVWGLIGLKRQRESAVSQHGIRLLIDEDPLSQRVHTLAARLGLKTRPWVGVMPHANAYAIGANADNALVVVGQPLIDTLTEAEMDAIIGHELGHIANNDMRRMGMARSFQNSLVWYLGFSNKVQRWARWALSWCSELFVLRLSRNREYWADAVGAALISKDAMISALEKIHTAPDLSEFEREHVRLMFRGIASGSMLSTHPTLEERRTALHSEVYLARIPVLRLMETALLRQPESIQTAESIAYAKKQ